MTVRRLYLARHGAANALGELTETGRSQARLLGERLSAVPVDVVWHSPLPRAVDSAAEIAGHLPGVPVIETPELVDHVPYVPRPHEMPESWRGFFDGYDEAEAAAGEEIADALVARFGGVSGGSSRAPADTHELLLTHAYPIAWLLRHAMSAPAHRWLALSCANAALTVVEHRSGQPPTVVMVNDTSHLPPDLQWTGFGAHTWP